MLFKISRQQLGWDQSIRYDTASSAASRQQREESPSRADEQDNSIIQDVHPAAQIFASTRVLLLCDIDEAICTAAASFLQSGGAKVFRKYTSGQPIEFMVLGLQPGSSILPQYVWTAFQRRSTDISHVTEVRTPEQRSRLHDHLSSAYYKFLDEKFDWSYVVDKSGSVPAVGRSAMVAVGDTTLLFGGRSQTSDGELVDGITALVATSRINFEVFTLPVKVPTGAGREGVATATDNRRYVYLAGGRTTSDCDSATSFVWRFDARTFEILRLPDLPDARCGGSMALLDGQLHFLGGSAGQGALEPTSGPHYVLKVEDVESSQGAKTSPKWEQAVPLPFGIAHHLTVVLLDGAETPWLYVIGGARSSKPLRSASGAVVDCDRGDGIVRSKQIFKLSPCETHWLRCADLPLQISHFESSSQPVNYGGGVLIFGGVMTAKDQNSEALKSMGTRNVVLFDARRNATALVGQMSRALLDKNAEGCGREGLVTLTNLPFSDNKIWVMGGEFCEEFQSGGSRTLRRRFQSQAVSVSSNLIN